MGRTIETSIEINAPPKRVWDILTDFKHMPDWNPFITAISGSLQAGSRLSVQITPPGKRAMTFKPTVTVLKAEHELRWLGRLLMPGIFDGEHYLVLASDGRDRMKFTQGETFNGLLVGMFSSVLSATEAGFNAMNEALKRRAEESASVA